VLPNTHALKAFPRSFVVPGEFEPTPSLDARGEGARVSPSIKVRFPVVRLIVGVDLYLAEAG
jgi:hypothetical protein